MMGTGISIAPGKNITEIGGWCMDVNIDGTDIFRFNTHFTFGVDLYEAAPACSSPNCNLFCGNSICDAGETTTNCPIDCKKLVCP